MHWTHPIPTGPQVSTWEPATAVLAKDNRLTASCCGCDLRTTHQLTQTAATRVEAAAAAAEGGMRRARRFCFNLSCAVVVVRVVCRLWMQSGDMMVGTEAAKGQPCIEWIHRGFGRWIVIRMFGCRFTQGRKSHNFKLQSSHKSMSRIDSTQSHHPPGPPHVTTSLNQCIA